MTLLWKVEPGFSSFFCQIVGIPKNAINDDSMANLCLFNDVPMRYHRYLSMPFLYQNDAGLYQYWTFFSV